MNIAVGVLVVAVLLLAVLLLLTAACAVERGHKITARDAAIRQLRSELTACHLMCAKLHTMCNKSTLLIKALRARCDLEDSPRAPEGDEMLRRLLMLCHPDKHNNSKAANEATQYLLKLRSK